MDAYQDFIDLFPFLRLAQDCVLPVWLTSLLAPLVLSSLIAMETRQPEHPLIVSCHEQSVSLMASSDTTTAAVVRCLGDGEGGADTVSHLQITPFPLPPFLL